MPTARVNDIEIYYELHGSGEPLVLIPGLGSDVRLLEDYVGSLATDRQVLAFDPRGAGRTDKPDAPYSLGTMADDAAGLMEATGMGSAHILGFSLGGRIALDLALHHPARVRSLVLVSSSARTPRTLGKTRRQYVLDKVGGLPLVRAVVPPPDDAYLRQREATRGYDCTDRLGEIRVPALVLHGRKDTVVTLALARKTAAGLEGSTMRIFDGGHLFFLIEDQPGTISAIREFLPPA